MSTLRLLLVAALVAAGFFGSRAAVTAGADPVQSSEFASGHRVTLQEGEAQNLITVVDMPGSQVRVWMRMPDGGMAFAAMGVISPTGFVAIVVPKAAKIPGLPRYLVVTSGPQNDIRDWLE